MASLTSTEDRLHFLLDGVRHSAIFMTDPDGRILTWNAGGQHIHGFAPHEIVAQNVARLYPPEDVASGGPRSDLEQARADGQVRAERWRMRQNGTRFRADVLIAPLIDEDRRLAGFAHIITDITERHLTEQALRESADRFRAIFDQASVAISQSTLDGRWLHFNDRLCQITGYARHELEGRSFHDITHPDDRQATRANMARLLAGETDTYALEKRYIRKDGSPIWVSISVSLVRDEGGDPRYLIAIIQDIDWRKQAEEELRSVLTHARCILWRAEIQATHGWDTPDASGRHFSWDISVQDETAAQQVVPLDLAPGTPYIDTWLQSRHPDDLPHMDRTFISALQCGERFYSQEFRCRDRDGLIRWLHEDVSLRPVALRRWHAFGVVTDVTQRKLAEEERTQLLHREQQARAEAEAANRRKDQFLAVLSHELRTPLTPVLARIDLLTRQPDLPPGVRVSLDAIQRNVQLEVNLINDLLDLTRITRGTLQLIPQTVDAHQTLRATLDIFQSQIADKRLTVDLLEHADQSHVRADPTRLQQVFWNLLSNAVKFTPASGTITIRTSNDAGLGIRDSGRGEGQPQALDPKPEPRYPNLQTLSIEVSDTGIGIDPDIMARIFDPFEQGEQILTRRYGGLGLGLSISKTLVHMHGGTLTAHSSGRHHGATFTVRLPTVPAPAPAVAAAGEPPPIVPPKPLRLLLVEDNADTARALAQVLRTRGHTVVTADSIQQALTVADQEPLDLLVCDIGLPDGTGWDLMRQLRARHAMRGIALSGFGQDDDIQKSLQAGFDRHLVKPVNLQQLEAALSQLAA